MICNRLFTPRCVGPPNLGRLAPVAEPDAWEDVILCESSAPRGSYPERRMMSSHVLRPCRAAERLDTARPLRPAPGHVVGRYGLEPRPGPGGHELPSTGTPPRQSLASGRKRVLRGHRVTGVGGQPGGGQREGGFGAAYRGLPWQRGHRKARQGGRKEREVRTPSKMGSQMWLSARRDGYGSPYLTSTVRRS